MQDIAASYLLGALGGIIYLRLLNRSVDSIGGASLGAAAGGLASQPRLLIPVILVLASNRCEALLFCSFFRSIDCDSKIGPLYPAHQDSTSSCLNSNECKALFHCADTKASLKRRYRRSGKCSSICIRFWGKQIHQIWDRMPKKYLKHANVWTP
jgi:hypothetical protein